MRALKVYMFPSAESISEMKVQGAGGGAEYGGAADITHYQQVGHKRISWVRI